MGEGAAAGGDVTGRDKIVAGGHVIQAAAGATVIIGGPVPNAVNESLNAVSEMVQRSPAVREAVVGFRTDFQAANDQIVLLGDFKDLHDILHRVQFQVFNGIQQIGSRFPDDDMSIDTLTDAQLTLEGIINEVREFAKRISEARTQADWLQDLVDTHTDLQASIDAKDVKAYKKSIWRLNRLLAIQPAKINGRLISAAKAVRLTSLTQALNSILGNVKTLELEADKKTVLENGVNGLLSMSQTLTTLIESHDAWQGVDVELRRIESTIDQDSTELEMSWPDLKVKCEVLYKDSQEDWATAIGKEASGLDEALAAQNPAKVKRSFRSYRRRASDRFFRVDVDLKTLCGDLRLVGQPLAAILKMVE